MKIKRQTLHHVSAFSDFFITEKKPKTHKVILLKQLDKNNLDPLFSLFSETIQEGKDIVFASKDSQSIQGIIEKINLYLKSDEVIPPFSVSKTTSTKKGKNTDTKCENSQSSLCLFSVTIKSNMALKQLESSAKFALNISNSCYVGITPPPLRLKINEQLSLIKGRVEDFLKLAKATQKFDEKKNSQLISNMLLSLKKCQAYFKDISKDLINTPVKLSHHLFYDLFVSIMKFLKKIIYLKLDLPKINFQIFRLEQLMNPTLQTIWNSQDHCFILDQSLTSYLLYTDASVLKKSQGSFAGALTLESGHIIKSWNYRLSELITDANTVELLAIIYALYQVRDLKEKLIVQTDSEIAIETLLNYSICGKVTFHLSNNPLFCEIFSKLPRFNDTHIQHVKSHSNCAGNIFVDKAASYAHKHGNIFSWKSWALEILNLEQTQENFKELNLLVSSEFTVLNEAKTF